MSSNKVKVLFITPFTLGGGAARNMFNIIGQLHSSHDLRLLVTSSEEVPNEYSTLIPYRVLGRTSVIGARKEIIYEIKNFEPDFIFCTSLNVGFTTSLCCKIIRSSSKIVARCPVTPSEEYHKSLKNRLLKYALRFCGRYIDLVIAQTEYMRQDLIKIYKFNPGKVKHIPNIIDIDHVKKMACQSTAPELNPSYFNILAVGALYSVKGFDLLIDAMASLIERDKNLRLYILGEERYEPGYKDFLQNKINDLKLTKYIYLLGSKENPFTYYKECDLFVLSSRKEGFPNVVLEALALHTPVVATNVVDFSNVIISGVNGFIVEKNSIDALIGGIRKAINNKWEFTDTLHNFDYSSLFRISDRK